jgi:hypothetical protein
MSSKNVMGTLILLICGVALLLATLSCAALPIPQFDAEATRQTIMATQVSVAIAQTQIARVQTSVPPSQPSDLPDGSPDG